MVWRPADEAWDGTPIGRYLSHLRDAGVGDFTLTDTAPSGRNFITYQGGSGATCATVPAMNRTWGQVKALYR